MLIKPRWAKISIVQTIPSSASNNSVWKRRSVRCIAGVLNDSDNATVKVDDHLEPLGYHLLHLTNKINWILKGFDQPPGKLTDFSNNSANSCCGVTQHLAIKVLLSDADVFNIFWCWCLVSMFLLTNSNFQCFVDDDANFQCFADADANFQCFVDADANVQCFVDADF